MDVCTIDLEVTQLSMRGDGSLLCVRSSLYLTHHQVRVMAEGGDDVAGVGDSVVTEQCLQELLDFFVKSAYRAKTVDRRVSAMNNAVNMQSKVRVRGHVRISYGACTDLRQGRSS